MNGKRILSLSEQIQERNSDTDGKNNFEHDLEFVDVEGGAGDAMDDPHNRDTFAINDDAHYKDKGYTFTSFLHFIDIGKGKGIYDDFDGYSYSKGSAHIHQYESMSKKFVDAFSEKVGDTLGSAAGKAAAGLMELIGHGKVDSAITGYWFNDEYVHRPGGKWYQNCSPSLWRYSFPNDQKYYANKYDELAKRFPTAKSTGTKNRGIPYSIFTPLDNLGRYWYERYLITNNPVDLGSLLHAVQDATVPHHAAGYLGNYHANYENKLESYVDNICNGTKEASFKRDVLSRYNLYNNKGTPITSISTEDHGRIPKKAWRVDYLITWLALHAYNSYKTVYNEFKKDIFNEDNAYELTVMACAMSMMVLQKAKEEIETDAQIPADQKVTSVTIEIVNREANNYKKEFQLLFYGSQTPDCAFFDTSVFKPSLSTVNGKTKWSATFNTSQYNLDFNKFLIGINKTQQGEWKPETVHVTCRTADGKTHYYINNLQWNITVGNECYQTIPKLPVFPKNTKVGSIKLTYQNAKRHYSETKDNLVLHASWKGTGNWKLAPGRQSSNG